MVNELSGKEEGRYRMKFSTIDDALRSIRNDDNFVNGVKAIYIKDETDAAFIKALIDANEGMPSDDFLMLLIERDHIIRKDNG